MALLACCIGVAAVTLLGTGAAQAQAGPAAADPSSQQVYDAARAGKLGLAQQMIDQVLRDHPGSAKAHYVAAEVYARSGNLARARQELGSAQTLNPGLSFAAPAAVAQLERELSAVRYGNALAGQPHRSVSWGAVVLILAGVLVLVALLRRRAVGAQPYGTYPGQPGAPGMYPGGAQYPGQYPPVGPYGQRMGSGSGLMGNLATGLAVGAGVAAGEGLVQHLLGGSQQGGIVPTAGADELGNAPNADMGGADFGLSSDNGSWDDGGGVGGDGGGADFGGDAGGGDWT
ncbi:MAG TPA: tetratricopeptide repeat protein [Steroidobacteraceae bacterium]|nr:tetratricopeptide repeat protein [Steroidobacteraceae bacterium]